MKYFFLAVSFSLMTFLSYSMKNTEHPLSSIPFTLAIYIAPTYLKDPHSQRLEKILIKNPDIIIFQNKNNSEGAEALDKMLKTYHYEADGIRKPDSLCTIGIAYKHNSFINVVKKDSHNELPFFPLPGHHVLVTMEQKSTHKKFAFANILYTTKNAIEAIALNAKIIDILSQKPADITTISGNIEKFSDFDKNKIIKSLEEQGYKKFVIEKKVNPYFVKGI